MIHEELCTYEVAKLAKEKGFDWICLHYFRPNDKDLYMVFPRKDWGDIREKINAPTQSLLQRWLREEKGIIIELKYSDDTESFRPFWSWQIYNTLGITLEIGEPNTTYELALEDALKYAFENLV